MRVAWLTTTDNPFDPFDQFEDWYAFDQQHGYGTCEYLARITRSSDELSEVDQANANETAIDEILQFNLTGNYKKIVKEIE